MGGLTPRVFPSWPLFVAAMGLVLAGCAAPSGYGSSNTFFDPTGYSDKKIKEATYQIDARGNHVTGRRRVDDMALRRAAELTLENGATHFVVADSRYLIQVVGPAPNPDRSTGVLVTELTIQFVDPEAPLPVALEGLPVQDAALVKQAMEQAFAAPADAVRGHQGKRPTSNTERFLMGGLIGLAAGRDKPNYEQFFKTCAGKYSGPTMAQMVPGKESAQAVRDACTQALNGPRAQDPDYLALMYVRRAEANRALADYPAAIEDATAVIDMYEPRHDVIRAGVLGQNIGLILLTRAMSYAETGVYAAAVKDLERMLAVRPNDRQAFRAKGLLEKFRAELTGSEEA